MDIVYVPIPRTISSALRSVNPWTDRDTTDASSTPPAVAISSKVKVADRSCVGYRSAVAERGAQFRYCAECVEFSGVHRDADMAPVAGRDGHDDDLARHRVQCAAFEIGAHGKESVESLR
ncbi:hypothetical protein ACWCPQ_04480 [Nocardia sp. NPDC001965]